MAALKSRAKKKARKRKKKVKTRNLVAKHLNTFNKPVVMKDKTKYDRNKTKEKGEQDE